MKYKLCKHRNFVLITLPISTVTLKIFSVIICDFWSCVELVRILTSFKRRHLYLEHVVQCMQKRPKEAKYPQY